MLASRRQPLHLALGHPSQEPNDYNFDFSSPPRRSSSSSSFSNYLPSPANYDTDSLQQNYISPSPVYPAPALSIAQGAFADDYMTSGYDFSGPAIRVQQSTPTPQLSFAYPQQSVLADGGAQITNNWLYGEGNGQMMPGSSLQTPAVIRRNRSHQRVPSSSSAGSSSSPASPFSQGHAPQIMYGNAVQSPSTSKLQSSYNADEASRNYSNHLPTPTQTPTQDSFVASSQPSFNNSYPNLDTATAAHMAMRQALADANSVTGDDAPDFSHSTRHSVSSFGRNSPATPRTINGEDFDEGFKVPSNETYRTNTQVPKLERTMTDVFSDELYNPTSQPTSAQKAKNTSLLSPWHNAMMNERLQQANQARSQSPTTSSTRALSPFRQASPYAPTNSGFQSPAGRFGPQQIREQRQMAEAQANALSRPNEVDSPSEPKTISPKDAVLEYHESEEDAKMPLFPDGDTASFSTFSSGNFQNSIPATAADNSYGGLAVGNAWTNPHVGQSSASYGSATSAAAPRQNHFSFTPASVPGAPHGLHSNTFSSSGNMPANTEETPEFDFPAHLTSMESSVSEAPPQSSQNSNHTDIAAKPSSTLADTGTYTCTYHGCTQRFETPQKLQRHKREAHRQSTQQQPQSSQASSAVGSGMTSHELLLRNSQQGPHKCVRINPSTQKPCNTIFSRPYDLTRHEDTIHNSRKQKVRCALCVNEEKTFSRNDALTRHMRVVHPDVDFPGKHRRRGGRGDD